MRDDVRISRAREVIPTCLCCWETNRTATETYYFIPGKLHGSLIRSHEADEHMNKDSGRVWPDDNNLGKNPECFRPCFSAKIDF